MTTSDEVLRYIVNHNAARLSTSQGWCLGVYWAAGLAMCLETYVLAAVAAWYTQHRLLSSLPDSHDVRYATLYWMYPLLLLNFLITAGSGMTGWAVVGALYFVAAIALTAHGHFLTWKAQRDRGRGRGPLTNSDGTIAAEQLHMERELLLQFRHTHPCCSAIQLRVARIVARYNPDRIGKVDEMVANYAHAEQRLITDLLRKYGLEPDAVDLDLPVPVSATPRATSGSLSSAVWRRVPYRMAPGQCASIFGASFGLLLCLAGCLMIVYLWDIEEFLIASRPSQGTDVVPVVETQPQLTAKALQLMYAWPGLASDLRLQFYTALFTTHCGDAFKEYLPDREARNVIRRDWIDTFRINMSEFVPSEWYDYDSVNSWFIRSLRPGVRPIAGDDSTVVSPADSRMLVFRNITSATTLWIKGGRFTWREMMDYEPIDGDDNYFEGGTVVVARLAPQDYHRFHSPVRGQVRSARQKKGTYWSVGPDAVLSGNDVFLNQRQIVTIDAGPLQGKVGYVAIGATCVGSVVIQSRDAQGNAVPLSLDRTVERGEELGFMQFGGSTVVMMFRRGAIIPACDLLRASSFPVETYVKMGEAIGRFSSDATYSGVGSRCENL
jgi:phosphatidylserine decarboxylase precursor